MLVSRNKTTSYFTDTRKLPNLMMDSIAHPLLHQKQHEGSCKLSNAGLPSGNSGWAVWTISNVAKQHHVSVRNFPFPLLPVYVGAMCQWEGTAGLWSEDTLCMVSARVIRKTVVRSPISWRWSKTMPCEVRACAWRIPVRKQLRATGAASASDCDVQGNSCWAQLSLFLVKNSFVRFRLEPGHCCKLILFFFAVSFTCKN